MVISSLLAFGVMLAASSELEVDVGAEGGFSGLFEASTGFVLLLADFMNMCMAFSMSVVWVRRFTVLVGFTVSILEAWIDSIFDSILAASCSKIRSSASSKLSV